jgi:Na+/H+-dicarboxylate symporter
MVGGAIVYLNDWKDNQMSDDDEMLCPLDLGDIEMKPPSKKKRSKASGGDSVKVNTMLIDNSIPAPPISTPPRSRTAFSKSKNTSEFDELPTAQVVLQFCMEMSNLSNTVVGWIVSAAPLCMGFLIARSLGDAGSLVDLMQNVGVYVAACLTGMLIHVTVVLPALLHYFTGLNPYTHIFSCRKAILVAFSTASSIATLPMTIQCCVQTNCVSPVIANVVLPMGTNLVKDGLAVGLSCAVMFLAHSDNLSSKLSVIVWFSMSVSAFLGAIGTAPIQSAGLVTVITVWEAGFPNHDVPSAISYLQAIDFITDRFVTTTGVISNIVITTILQFMIDKERSRNEAKTRGSVS